MALWHSAKIPRVIPAEIWIHVMQFIPHTDLSSTLSVSRLFFELSMDARYHELSFVSESDRTLRIRRLKRVRDPSISHRVRRLYINIEDLDVKLELLYRHATSDPGRAERALLEEMQLMTETVALLTNVTEFSMQWENGPPKEQVVPFLNVAWKSFGSGLRRLSLRVTLRRLVTLLSTADGLVTLRDLDVTIDTRGRVDAVGDGEMLSAALAPFVNKFGPSLHSLSYHSVSHDLDPTPFFDRLEKIPNLERLRFSVFSSGVGTLSKPFAVTRFLCDHAPTLRHLDWNGKYGMSPEQLYMHFQSGYNLEDVFSNLRSLKFVIPNGSFGFSLVVQHLRCSAETLTSLILFGYTMTYTDVNTVISIFTPHSTGNLNELRVPVDFLSPELILLIAQTLPRLKKLAIHFKRVTGDEAGKRTLAAINADSWSKRESEERLYFGIFADTMRKYDFCGWELHDIDFQGFCCDLFLSEKLMQLVAECVPSVQTFRGKTRPRSSIQSNPNIIFEAERVPVCLSIGAVIIGFWISLKYCICM